MATAGGTAGGAPAGGAPAPTAPLRRRAEGRVVAGVCAGIAERLGADPLLVRVAFIAAATTGLGFVLYALGWALLPVDGAAAPAGRIRTGRAAVEVGLGAGLLVLSALLAMRGLGLWFSDAVAWPLVLIAAGGALLWRQSQTRPAPATPRETARRAPISLPDVSRTGVGIALVVAAGVVFLQVTGALGAARDVALVAVVVAVVVGVIFAPFLVRLARERVQQRERAEVAAHLHDSVLQTLALVQKRADDPAQVAALARRQERELRAWLSGRTATQGSLVPALEHVAGDVEQAHGVPIEVVASGDRPLDPRGEALVAAAREAMTNAAKHGGGAVALYAEVRDDRATVFVRDRGPGFDPAAVPEDRRGVRESIVGRMERNGGGARIGAAPGGGTEVELWL
ncbi:MAG TPA: PspC domain-containing protein [Solirubrobacteraceae bacterium]|nr:PspC domain-containing protein [Solirubrobacteraceae bacterium]